MNAPNGNEPLTKTAAKTALNYATKTFSLKAKLLALAVAVLLAIAGLGAALLFAVLATDGGQERAAGIGAGAQLDIPPRAMAAYAHASESITNARFRGCQIPWWVLAAVGKIETNHGRYDGDGKVRNIDERTGRVEPPIVNAIGAAGPMQFLVATWNWIVKPNRELFDDSTPDIQDIDDAALGTALLLCTSAGVANPDLSDIESAPFHDAVFAYNHAEWYVDDVRTQAAVYRDTAFAVMGTNGAYAVDDDTTAGRIINEAMAQRGKPYRWGAIGPKEFDCSGLTMWAYKHGAGIQLPRTTEGQINVGLQVDVDDVEPGDLVFNWGGQGTGRKNGHVSIYIGDGLVVTAPKTGDVVKTRPYIPSRVSAVRRPLWQTTSRRSQRTTKPTSTAPATTPRTTLPPRPVTTTPTEILYIGDSLAVGTARPLATLTETRGVPLHVSARVGRATTLGPTEVRRLLAAHPNADILLIDLGTNGPLGDPQPINEIATIARTEGIRLVWINVAAPQSQRFNQLLQHITALDWASQPDATHTTDGIHYTPAGYQTRAEYITCQLFVCTPATTRSPDLRTRVVQPASAMGSIKLERRPMAIDTSSLSPSGKRRASRCRPISTHPCR